MQWPRRFRERCAFSKPHCLRFYPRPWFRDVCKQGSTVYGYPIAPAESSPLPWSGEPIMPLHLKPVKLSCKAGIRNPDPRCVATANENCNCTVRCLSPLCHRGSIRNVYEWKTVAFKTNWKRSWSSTSSRDMPYIYTSETDLFDEFLQGGMTIWLTSNEGGGGGGGGLKWGMRAALWKGYWLEENGKLTDIWSAYTPTGTNLTSLCI